MERTLTPKQILEIYEAGIRRGGEEYSAYDWGGCPSGNKLDELEDVLVWDSTSSCRIDLVEYDDKKIWWEEFKNEIA